MPDNIFKLATLRYYLMLVSVSLFALYIVIQLWISCLSSRKVKNLKSTSRLQTHPRPSKQAQRSPPGSTTPQSVVPSSGIRNSQDSEPYHSRVADVKTGDDSDYEADQPPTALTTNDISLGEGHAHTALNYLSESSSTPSLSVVVKDAYSALDNKDDDDGLNDGERDLVNSERQDSVQVISRDAIESHFPPLSRLGPNQEYIFTGQLLHVEPFGPVYKLEFPDLPGAFKVKIYNFSKASKKEKRYAKINLKKRALKSRSQSLPEPFEQDGYVFCVTERFGFVHVLESSDGMSDLFQEDSVTPDARMDEIKLQQGRRKKSDRQRELDGERQRAQRRADRAWKRFRKDHEAEVGLSLDVYQVGEPELKRAWTTAWKGIYALKKPETGDVSDDDVAAHAWFLADATFDMPPKDVNDQYALTHIYQAL